MLLAQLMHFYKFSKTWMLPKKAMTAPEDALGCLQGKWEMEERGETILRCLHRLSALNNSSHAKRVAFPTALFVHGGV